MLRAILLILLLALAAAPVRAAEPVSTVSYRIDYGGWYVVPVTVNGRGPFDFIVDTGATHSIVFGNLHAIENFPPTGGPPQRVLGLAASGRFPTYHVGELALGPARLSSLVTVVLDEWKVGDTAPYGVLGLDFLSRYFVLVDRDRGEVRLYDSRQPLELDAPGWTWTAFARRRFPLVDDATLFTVDGHVEKRSVRFMVDLGATGTIINEKARARIEQAGSFGISLNPRNGRTGSRVRDALNERAEQHAMAVGRLRLGRVTWYDQIVYVHDAPIFDELGVQEQAFGLLGADLFHRRSFAMDFAGERLWIGPKGGR